ncbi:hypothetical protein CHCC14814_3042 [Bacillus paralicheniformis]|nr:hypothetical protein CHCC14814_3042 [Bacillus paralicheniformis]
MGVIQWKEKGGSALQIIKKVREVLEKTNRTKEEIKIK